MYITNRPPHLLKEKVFNSIINLNTDDSFTASKDIIKTTFHKTINSKCSDNLKNSKIDSNHSSGKRLFDLDQIKKPDLSKPKICIEGYIRKCASNWRHLKQRDYCYNTEKFDLPLLSMLEDIEFKK